MLLAQAPEAAKPEMVQPFWMNPMFLIPMMVLFWVIVILPMGRRQKKEKIDLLAKLKRGDKVLTASGIVGTITVAKENEDEVVIRSEDSKFRIKRSTVTQVFGTDETEASK